MPNKVSLLPPPSLCHPSDGRAVEGLYRAVSHSAPTGVFAHCNTLTAAGRHTAPYFSTPPGSPIWITCLVTLCGCLFMLNMNFDGVVLEQAMFASFRRILQIQSNSLFATDDM